MSGNSGRYRAATDAARANVETRRLETGYQTRRAYLGLMLADVTLKSVQASQKRLDIIKTDIQNLFDNGLADSTDILETDLAYQKILLQADYQNTARTNAVLEACRDEGVLLGQGGMWGHCVRIGPSLLVTADEIDEGLEKLGRACATVEG